MCFTPFYEVGLETRKMDEQAIAFVEMLRDVLDIFALEHIMETLLKI